LLLEHHPVYTVGLRGALDHLRVPAEDLGADMVATDRGGDVTWHGPGQLVGYPILSLPTVAGVADTPAYVHALEQVLIDALGDLGVPSAGRLDDYPGVWVDPGSPNPRKIAAIGVRNIRGRTMHGFALNVDPDLSWFDRIVPCGIADMGVTSLAAEGVHVTMRQVVDAVIAATASRWGYDDVERADVSWERETPAGMPVATRKPEWLRIKADLGEGYREVKKTMRSLKLVTVCEEAGCPNIYECWRDGTATFMINGDRCTRACGFCQVDTRKPLAADPEEPERLAEAVAEMGLAHAVITAVARDDLPDGGAAGFAASIGAVRRRCPGTAVEVLIPDCKGSPEALTTIFEAGPDVLNHNLETVARLQRHVRPSASYARSLAVLARAAAAGLVAKSGLSLGMGETEDEVLAAMADLQRVG
ncbi:MAG TPA: lipoyl(octanoyl) transferase LipB, partial [Acidimicrobiales bacterium]|nr:lipoyl(octanoyl) transferase LipB [Acidimicrobiales bacterium]